MASTSSGGNKPLETTSNTNVNPVNVLEIANTNISYADKLKPKVLLNNYTRVPPKPVIMLRGNLVSLGSHRRFKT